MEKRAISVKDSALAFGVGFAVVQLAVLIFTLLGLTIGSFFNISLQEVESFLSSNAIGYLLTTIVLDSALLGVFLFFKSKREFSVFKKAKVSKIFIYILIGVLSFFCLYPISACINSLFEAWQLPIVDLPYNLSTKNYLISLISLVILPAICEELVYRGVIFKGLKKHGKAFSIILTAIMFAIFHFSYQQLIYPLLFGLLLSLVMWFEDNIIYTMILHATNNFLSITRSYFNINLVFNHWSYIVLAILLLIAFLCVVIVLTVKNQPKKGKIDNISKNYLLISFGAMIFLWFVVNIYNIIG